MNTSNASVVNGTGFDATSDRVIWFGLTIIISEIGASASFLTCIAILRRRSRTGSGLLILHQQITEGTLLGVVMLMTNVVSWRAMHGKAYAVDCRIVHFFVQSVQLTNYWTLFCIACNRKSGRAKSGQCGTLKFPDVVWTELRTAIGYYFPMAGAGLIYITILISYRLRQSRRTVPWGENMRRIMARRFRLTILFFVTYVIWFLCYIPTPLIVTFGEAVYLRNPDVALWLRLVTISGCAMNPVSPFRLIGQDSARINLF